MMSYFVVAAVVVVHVTKKNSITFENLCFFFCASRKCLLCVD